MQVLGYFIYIVIALAFLTAYYEWKKDVNKLESVNSENAQNVRAADVPS